MDILKMWKILINWALTEATIQSCSEKKLFWKFSKNTQEHIHIEVQIYKNYIPPQIFFWNVSMILCGSSIEGLLAHALFKMSLREIFECNIAKYAQN